MAVYLINADRAASLKRDAVYLKYGRNADHARSSHGAVTALVEEFVMMRCQERTAKHQLQDQRL